MHMRNLFNRFRLRVQSLFQGPADFSTIKPTWSGIYEHFRDVPVHDGVFDCRLIDGMVATTAAAAEETRSGQTPSSWHQPLALLAAVTAANTGAVRILDFGGGAGSGFVQILGSLPSRTRIDYHVVDLPEMCDKARNIFPGESRIHFHTELQHVWTEVDILYVNSVLQYFENYRAKITELCARKAPLVLLSRLAAGSNPTFATQQVNIPGQILPYWFINRDEVVKIMADEGYDLICESLCHTSYDQSNLPATHRCERMRDMLFALLPPAEP